jgi:hypothetical protein
MELRWLKLGRSYQFAEQLGTFTGYNNQQRAELTERLEKLRRKLETGSSSLASKRRVPE